jgi:RNA polymerase sigma-70 factor (ECF subfamily)
MAVEGTAPAVGSRPDAPASPPAWEQAGDAELLAALARGEHAAFDALFARHGAPVLTFISRLVAGRADPEDLLQETFLRILEHAGEFLAGSDFKPWLYTIARNAAYGALKKARLREAMEVKTDLSDWSIPSRAASADEPAAEVELDEQKARAVKALEKLPVPHREILVLTLFDGFSYEEAARITGEPIGTLRSRVFYALRKLRDLLGEA